MQRLLDHLGNFLGRAEKGDERGQQQPLWSSARSSVSYILSHVTEQLVVWIDENSLVHKREGPGRVIRKLGLNLLEIDGPAI